MVAASVTPILKGKTKQLETAERSELITYFRQYKSMHDEWLRRQVLEHDRIDLLASEILGYQVLPFHLSLLRYQFMHRESMQLAFRGSGKSTMCTITKSIHYLLKNSNLRILIASKSLANAQGFLKEIKGHFENNEDLARIFGEYYDPRRVNKWDSSEIEVLPRTKHAKEASITCVSVEGTIISKHYDVILSDDLIDEDNSRTQTMRDKVKTWFYSTLEPTLEPPDSFVPHRGEHHRLGTRFHFADLYGHWIENELKDHHRYVRALDEKGRSPWPEKFPPSWFKEKRRKSGMIIFNAQYQCHSDDTEFLTEDGWKLFEDIKDERLATYNLMTGELNHQIPKKRIKEFYEGNLLYIKSKKVDAFVTPNHQMICKPQDYPSKENWNLIDAGRLSEKISGRTRRVLFPSRVEWKGEEKSVAKIEQGWREDRWGAGIWDEYSKIHHGPRDIELDVFLRFLGFFISEGSSSEKSRGELSLSQDEGSVLNSMRETLGEMKLGVKEYGDSGENIKLYFRHIRLYDWLRDNVKTKSSDARIPREVFKLSKRQLMIIFSSLVAGDGHIVKYKKGHSYQYTTTSKQLADDVSEIGLMIGYDSSVAKTKDKYWRVCLRRAIGNGITESQIEEVPYSGNVVCFKVPNGTLITRRNGKILISGNCDTEAMKGEIFQYDDCQLVNDDDIPDGLKIFMGVDLAISEDEKADHFAIVVIGMDSNKNRYVIDWYDGQLRFNQQTKKIKKFYRKYDPIKCCIETNAYQKAQYQNLKDDDKDIRLKPVHQDKDKIARAWKLTSLFEDKKMFFKKAGGVNLIIEQLVLFPNFRYKDLFDALDLAVIGSKLKRKKKRRKEPGLI